MPKNKTHKGLLKRVKVTKSGRMKMHRAFGRHLRSHKPGSMIRQYRLAAFVSSADAKRLRTLLGLKVTRSAKAEAKVEAGTGAGTTAATGSATGAGPKGPDAKRRKPKEQ